MARRTESQMSTRPPALDMLWRTLAIGLLLTGLAGCDGTTGTSSSSQTCPGWMVGTDHANTYFEFSETVPNNPTNDTFPDPRTPSLHDGGRPLDLLYLYFTGPSQHHANKTQGVTAFDSSVEMTFFRNDTHEPLLAYDITHYAPGPKNAGQYHWLFGPGQSAADLILEIRLSQPPGKPTPTTILVVYNFVANLDHDASTLSKATVDYNVQYSYRVC